MNLNFLDFEQPIAELQEKIEELRRVSSSAELNISEEINRLEDKCNSLTKSIYSNLSAKQIVAIARHPRRPHPIDHIDLSFNDFNNLYGDRHLSQALSIISGLCYLDDQVVMVIGHEKGRSTKEKIERNFGMASPEGFRKALRMMKLAEKFNIPIITLIDTPGAYPGIQAEERNQSEAIARNLFEMARLKTPIICAITGEGCSGGALGIGVGDYLVMMQYSYFSVISPEGCASILWKDAKKSGEAAEAMNLTANRLYELKLIDEIIPEPLGGAHRNPEQAAASLRKTLIHQLKRLKQIPIEALVQQRYDKLITLGDL